MTTRRLTVVFCCNSAFGVANFRGRVVKALTEDGHRVVVVAPRDAYVESLERLGAEFEPWPVTGRGTHLRSEARAARALVRIYRRIRPDVSFHFTIKAVIYGAIAGRLSRTPFVSVITGLGYVFLNPGMVSTVARWLYRQTLRWSSEVWFLNEDDRNTLLQLRLVESRKVGMLPGEGVDTAEFVAAPLPCTRNGSGGMVFLMVARLLRDKGIHEFVEAARSTAAAYPSARFQLLGPADSDNPTAVSRAEVDTWVAEGFIDYLGVTTDVRPALAASDCVVLPSYREGTPLSLLEAASMARPVIATDVPGCAEVVVDGQTGWLCRPRDPDDLARCMREALKAGPDALRRMGAAGRRLVVERFDDALVIALYRAALQRLVSPVVEATS